MTYMTYAGKIIDAHAHVLNPDKPRELAELERQNGYDEHAVLSLEALYPGQNDLCFAHAAAFGGYVFAGLNHAKGGYDAQVDELVKRGAVGFKMIEGKPDAQKAVGFRLNDARLQPFYAACERGGLPVILHAGDPPEFWSRETAPAFAAENGWLYDDPSFPTLADIRAQVADVVTNFPRLKLTLAHFYFMGHDMNGAAGFLDAHPSVNFDICPGIEMYVHFSKNPEEWRRFFIEYGGRLTFGTDNCETESAKDAEDKAVVNRTIHNFLQTPLPFRAWDLELRGISLPQETLEKIYRKNFQTLIKRA